MTSDEFGQRLFDRVGTEDRAACQRSIGIWQCCACIGRDTGGVSVTIRGSGFQSATEVTLGGKQASVSFKDMNTLTIVTPALSPGPQQLVLINPNGEFAAFDAAFFAQ